jgi:hypothetical protein
MDMGPLPAICTIIVTSEGDEENWGRHPLLSLPAVGDIVSVDHLDSMTELRVTTIAPVEHDVPEIHATRTVPLAG